MKKNFLVNILFLLLINAIIKPLWVLGIDRGVQLWVGTGSYGSYFAILNLAIILNIFLDFGLTNYYHRKVASDPGIFPQEFSSVVLIKLVFGLIYFISGLMIAYVSGFSQRLTLVMAVLLNQFLLSMLLFMRSNLSGLKHYFMDSIISVTDKLIMILWCGYLLLYPHYFPNFDILDFAWMQNIAICIALLISFGFLRKNHTFRMLMPGWKKIFSIIKETMPFSLLVITMAIYYRIDGVMLKWLLPEGEIYAGVYAQGFRLLDAGSMIGALFAGLLLPMFSYLVANKGNVKELLKVSMDLMFFINLAVLAYFIFITDDISRWLYTHHLKETSLLLRWLIPCLFLVNITYILGTFLTSAGNLKQLNMISISGVVLNVILNLILIPEYNVLGAAMASFATQLLVMIMHAIILNQLHQGLTNWKQWAYYGGLLLLSLWVVYVLKQFSLEVKDFWIMTSIWILLTALFMFRKEWKVIQKYLLQKFY